MMMHHDAHLTSISKKEILCYVKHPAAKGCTDDGTLVILPIYG
jgi:hypothetical protein